MTGSTRPKTRHSIFIQAPRALLATAALLLALAPSAAADTIVVNDIDTGSDVSKYVGDTGSARVHMVAVSGSVDISGCNADATHAVTIRLTSSDVTKVSFGGAVSGTVQINTCDNTGTAPTLEGNRTLGYAVVGGSAGDIVTIYANYTSGGLGPTSTPARTPVYTNDTFIIRILAPIADTTDPVVTVPADITAEATSASGRSVTFSASANDDRDGALTPVCLPPSGSTFPLGATTVTCTATDLAGNEGSDDFSVTIRDTTAPTIAPHADVTAEATGPTGASVAYTAPATSDLVDGADVATCLPASPVTVAVGASTLVSCGATDDAGNAATSTSFLISVVDTTAPVVVAPADITVAATSPAGRSVTIPAATWTDAVDGSGTTPCTPGTGTFPIGTTTVTCSRTDGAGNLGTDTFTVTVTDFITGFYAPVDMGGTVNTLKGGASVPLKFNVYRASGEVTDPALIRVVSTPHTCATTGGTDDIETPTSGQTSLRYDWTARQFVFNWQSPKVASSCYTISIDHDLNAATPGVNRAEFRTK